MQCGDDLAVLGITRDKFNVVGIRQLGVGILADQLRKPCQHLRSLDRRREQVNQRAGGKKQDQADGKDGRENFTKLHNSKFCHSMSQQWYFR